MAYKVTQSKKESLEQLKVLVCAFEKEYAIYTSSQYSEAQLRIDFLNPFLKTFGWDVDNEQSKSQFMREVLQEESIDVEEDKSVAKKNPDYTLRVQGIRKLFVEAKKVSIDIENASKPAFQIRRYGWNANLGISILTNFKTIVVYDCRHKPDVGDFANVARYKSFHYSEYISKFDELYEILSYQSIVSGYVDQYFLLEQKETITFDNYFLKQIEEWRKEIAVNIIENNSGLNNDDINFLVQRLLNRIIFLRICEDREIEKYETLKKINNYNELKALFVRSDKKYNSGLFNFIEDNFSYIIDPSILIDIFSELYYPQSPYDFSVIDPSILSQIYEKYLGSRIDIVGEGKIEIIEEPEVAASNGVVPTPKLLAKNIIKETLDPLFKDKSYLQIQQLKTADICCGSGTFLISIYDYFLEHIILCFIEEEKEDACPELIYRNFDGSYSLSLRAKHKILTDNIFGVDINPYAVEVAKFSLLLKLLENENGASVNDFIIKYNSGILPNLDSNIKCGNSLIDDTYFKYKPDAIEDNNLLFKIKPFNWIEQFSFLEQTRGFDAIVGNPPYVRIQNIARFSSEEIFYYQSKISNYTVAASDAFDKYYLFIERAISLLNSNGMLGYIVPHKFFIVKGGKYLRAFVTENSSIFKIVHFGICQIFPDRSTYTTILILDKEKRDYFYFARIHSLSIEFITGVIKYDLYKSSLFRDLPWVFVSKATELIFEKIESGKVMPLHLIAEIAVGLQTSADKIYIFQPVEETDSTYRFKFKNDYYTVEKEICKPCLYDLSFDLFDTVTPNAQMIFPYVIHDGKAEVYTEEYFEKTYPLAWAYLNTFKDILVKRSINGNKNPRWYQYGRSQSLTRFHNTPKLIWSVLSTKPGYIYDENNIQFTGGGNGPYYSLFTKSEYSLYYIIGILSHPIFEAMIKSRASEFRGAYYSHGKQFIENTPIRIIDFGNEKEARLYAEIIKIVKELIKTKKILKTTHMMSKQDILKHKLDMLWNTLISQINSLYGITKEEIEMIAADELLNGDVNENF